MQVRTYVCIHTTFTCNYTHTILQADFQPIHLAARCGKVDILRYLGKVPGVDVHAVDEV